MRSDDPANADVLAVIHTGHAPPSVLNVCPGQRVDVQVTKPTEDDHVPPPAEPFSDARTPPAPARNASINPRLEVDTTQPTNSIQVRLANGTRLIARMNITHTVGKPVPRAAPTPSVPPSPCACSTPAAADARTVKEAGLGGAVVVQSWARRSEQLEAPPVANLDIERAAEVALRTGKALVPRLTALITASDRARQEQESWGTWKHVGGRLKNGGGREDEAMREVKCGKAEVLERW
ncbi:hypothetical protein B0H14DRAFT_3447904 [Mycena olivaceomarginata]|nr:hypothetical protein B0H14DRAFT_3447904 [Mycena olivaceomarginata]